MLSCDGRILGFGFVTFSSEIVQIACNMINGHRSDQSSERIRVSFRSKYQIILMYKLRQILRVAQLKIGFRTLTNFGVILLKMTYNT